MAAAGEEGRKRRPVALVLGAIGTILFLAGFVWLWWHWVPVLYQGFNGITQAERLTATANTRAALLAGLVGIGALGTLWLNSRAQRFTVQSLRLTEENLRLTKRSQEETFHLAQRGHLTDRYSKAIEQLGDDKLDVRLGGIYALEQLATDSPNDRDQATIIEVLSAFVRVHSAPMYQYREYRAVAGKSPSAGEGGQEASDEAEEYVSKLLASPVDVQAAVTVIGRLPRRSETERADFGGAWLRMTSFVGDFSRSTFANANLSLTFSSGATLRGVTFNGAKLVESFLNECDLRGSSFGMADLSRAVLLKADLRETQLGGMMSLPSAADREAVDVLTGANLSDAGLRDADLRGVDLTGANLARANLTGARLDGATLPFETMSEVIGLTAEQLAVIRESSEVTKGPGPEGLPAAFASVKEPWRIHRSNPSGSS